MSTASARTSFEKALKAGAARDYETSKKYLLEVLSLSDDMPEALLLLGRCYHSLGQPEKAIGAFRFFLRRNPDSAEGLYFLGRTYLSCGLFEKASRVLLRCVKVENRSGAAFGLLGFSLLKRKRPSAAVKCFEKAIALSPQDRRLYHGYLNALFVRGISCLAKGEFDLARQTFTFTLDNGLETGSQYLYRAMAYRELGVFDSAAADYETAQGIFADDPTIAWRRAMCLLAAGRTDEAFSVLAVLRAAGTEIPEIDWDADTAGRYAAMEAYRTGEYRTAVAEALAVLKRDGKEAPMHAIAAESFHRLGHLQKAENHWHRAVELDRANPDFRYGLAQVLFKEGKWNDLENEISFLERARHLPEATSYLHTLMDAKRGNTPPGTMIPRLQALVRTFGADPDLMEALALAYYASERPDLAEGWFRKTLAVSPEREYPSICLIAVYESLKDDAKLAAAYADYLSRYGDNTAILRECADFHIARGNWNEAVPRLESLVSYSSGDSRILRELASAYRNALMFREAALLYRDFVKADPKNPALVRALAVCLDHMGKTDIAVSILEKALKFIHDDIQLHLSLGNLLAKAGKTERALDRLRAASSLSPNDPRPSRSIAELYRKLGMASMAIQFEEQARDAELKNAVRTGKQSAKAKIKA